MNAKQAIPETNGQINKFNLNKMKKLILPILLFFVCFNSFSQTCEERENKLLNLMGSFSAGFLYNTYGLIGSIADGFELGAYNATTVTDLLDAQKTVADNMINAVEKISAENVFFKQTDKEYVVALINSIKGLKIQSQLLLVIVKNKTQKNSTAYEEQRTKNWKDLSKLMGIKE